MSDLLIPIILMVLFVLAEAGVLQFTGRQKIDWLDVIFNINSGQMMLWLFRCLEVLCYSLVINHFSFGIFDHAPVILLWLFTLLAWDFGFYWLHRWHHEMRPLWAVHVVHHQGEHYNLSLGVRNSWYSSLTSIPFFMLLAVLGVPLQVFLPVSIIHYSWQFFNHNALTPKLGWLEKVLITPSHHRIHHLNEKQYADTNYGGTFLWWDKLFRSFSTGPDYASVAFGVKNSHLSCNPMRESNLPFLRLIGLRSFGQVIERQYQSSPWAVGGGVILLFMLVLGYIQQYGYAIEFITREQVVLFLLLVVGSVALGGISDGQRWGMILWVSVTLSLLYFVLYMCSWSTLLWKGVAGVLLVHCVLFVAGIGRKPLRKRYEPV
ncbi:sterol desaturase family protein [Escherichia albertii]|uniref:sterol desaturase family protein n=1 Tax=Escherichia albertii TaxID=208962 RepID=UPI00235E864B|nr:sterol desaturase family protein [Escherichia albertii]WDC32656.1 sterol desaturase family protein [Escherichia albertii]